MKSRQHEIGLKAGSQTVDWSLAAFEVTRPAWSDVGACAADGSCVRQADGEARHRGLEAQADLKWSGGGLLGSAMWLQARREGAQGAGINGKKPVNVPAQQYRLALRQQLVTGLQASAALVRGDDNEKAGRMRYLYEVEISDPLLYDLMVNTETLPYDAIVQMIEALTLRPEMATTDAGRQTIASRALASRVQVALATHPETRRYLITVEAQGGVVTLEGTTALDRAVDVARTVAGVRDVRTQQGEIPPIPPFVA